MNITHIAVGQRHRSIGDLLPHTADDRIGKTKIELGLTGQMDKRHIQRLLFRPQFFQSLADQTITVGVIVFVAKAFVDTFASVPLFGRQRFVFGEGRVLKLWVRWMVPPKL